jgi:hypothetical protein
MHTRVSYRCLEVSRVQGALSVAVTLVSQLSPSTGIVAARWLHHSIVTFVVSNSACTALHGVLQVLYKGHVSCCRQALQRAAAVLP